MRSEVMPLYANTHSSSSACGLQTSQFVDEARQLIKDTLGCNEKDAVIFAGNGCTGAVDTLVRILGLSGPPTKTAAPVAQKEAKVVYRCRFPGCGHNFADKGDYLLHSRTHTDGESLWCPDGTANNNSSGTVSATAATAAAADADAATLTQASQTVVLIGPMEHHSNLLPWRESAATVIELPPDTDGRVDRNALAAALRAHTASCAVGRVIGAFSAASNVTGVMEDVDAVTELLHSYGALAVWDYACAAPHIGVDMNPKPAGHTNHAALAKDAVFVSPHKFPGGPGTPGLLLVKRSLLTNVVPSVPGGGSVFYVTSGGAHAHRYLANLEEREEAGTPNILGAIRTGLTVQLAGAVGFGEIARREASFLEVVVKAWRSEPSLCVLGSPKAKRVAVVSFMVRFPAAAAATAANANATNNNNNNSGQRFLHWNYVAALLNDLFGVQCRGGCMCAGPYGHRLLGIGPKAAAALESELLQENELLRPGWVRVSMPYYWKDSDVAFLRDAVLFVARRGWQLLPHYTFYPDTGEWRHRDIGPRAPYRRWLHSVSYNKGRMNWQGRQVDDGIDYATCLSRANALADAAEAGKGGALKLPDQTLVVPPSAVNLRWFALPSEAQTILRLQQHGIAGAAGGDSGGFDDGRGVSNTKATGTISLVPEFKEEEEEEPPIQVAVTATMDNANYTTDNSLSFVSGSTTEESEAAVAAIAVSVASSSMSDAAETLSPAEVSEAATSSTPVDGEGGAIVATSTANSAISSSDTTPAVCPLISFKRSKYANNKNSCADREEQEQQKEVTQEFGELGREECLDCVPGPRFAQDNTTNGNSNIGGGNGDGSSGGDGSGHLRIPLPVSAATSPLPRDTTMPPPAAAAAAAAAITDRQTNRQTKQSAPPPLFPKVPKTLMHTTGKCMNDFQMFREGDRVLLGLSGGKDSMTLLHVLHAMQRKSPVKWELGAVTMDPQFPGFDPSPLIAYMKRLGIPYFFESQDLLETAKNCNPSSICSWCSRMKRGILYTCARREGYNVLALGQHLDDMAESFFMSAFHNGKCATMKAHYMNNAGDIRITRPLAYTREKTTREFAERARLPVIPDNCPACFEGPKERYRIKTLLAKQEHLFPTVYSTLKNAMKPLMTDDTWQACLDAPPASRTEGKETKIN